MGERARMRELIAVGKRVGLFKKRTVKSAGFDYLEVLHDDKWINVFDPATNRHRNDNRNKRLIAPVLLRDGSNCRWCGMFVYKRASGSKLAQDERQIDHLTSDYSEDQLTKPHELVIACRSCNLARNKPNRTTWDASKLLPVPKREDKLFHKEAVEFLTVEAGYSFLKFEQTDIMDRYKLCKTQSKAEREVLVVACDFAPDLNKKTKLDARRVVGSREVSCALPLDSNSAPRTRHRALKHKEQGDTS
jgi:hypothetical protein